MSNLPASRAIHNHGDQPTLGTVLELIRDDPTLSSRQRQDTASALRSFARAMGHSVETCPAHPGYINARLKTFTPMQAGFAIPHWRNVLYRTRAALKHAGLVHMPGRRREPLSPPWQELCRQLPGNRERFTLSRFSRHCTIHGIAPGSVDDAVLERFRTALTEQSLAKNPREAHRSACQHWNKAAASIPSWPRQRVSVPDYRCCYVLPWSSFPASLKADADGYLTRLAGEDLLALGDFRPLRPASIKWRAAQLRTFVSALVRQGRDPHSLRTLADVVRLDAARLELRFHLDRNGGKTSSHINAMAYLLLAIARHWLRVEAGQEQELRRLCKGTAFGGGGMTEKNRALLRQFANPANMAALMALPRDLPHEAMKARVIDKPVARMVQTAVAIEMLVMFALRMNNLGQLDAQRHLPRHGQATRLLAIPGDEVKNGLAIDAALPADTLRLLDIYEKDYRPVLADQPSAWLFPGQRGQHKCLATLALQITKCVLARLGLVVHPHLFRHIAVKNFPAASSKRGWSAMVFPMLERHVALRT